MRFIHRDPGHAQFREPADELLGPQSLRADVQQLVAALAGTAQHITPFALTDAAVDGCHLGDATATETVHLIVHQGDERRQHEGHARQQERRDLVRDRFARSCRQHCKRVLACHEALHRLELTRSPVLEAEYLAHSVQAMRHNAVVAGLVFIECERSQLHERVVDRN